MEKGADQVSAWRKETQGEVEVQALLETDSWASLLPKQKEQRQNLRRGNRLAVAMTWGNYLETFLVEPWLTEFVPLNPRLALGWCLKCLLSSKFSLWQNIGSGRSSAKCFPDSEWRMGVWDADSLIPSLDCHSDAAHPAVHWALMDGGSLLSCIAQICWWSGIWLEPWTTSLRHYRME